MRPRNYKRSARLRRVHWWAAIIAFFVLAEGLTLLMVYRPAFGFRPAEVAKPAALDAWRAEYQRLQSPRYGLVWSWIRSAAGTRQDPDRANPNPKLAQLLIRMSLDPETASLADQRNSEEPAPPRAPKHTKANNAVKDPTRHASWKSGYHRGMALPILLYHKTPADFDSQLTHLERSGYTTIDLDELRAGLRGGPLPAKPVVITFDDGFADQMRAFELLKDHHMQATFYIINGGEASQWCIGSGRRYGDPLQPSAGCGDSYLTWDQVRLLDASGLITIGGHTLDHAYLTSLTEAEQRREIVDSKRGIEQELSHPIHHFAYPYGAFDTTSIRLVREAGYDTATTTISDTYQPDGSEYELRRVRDAFILP